MVHSLSDLLFLNNSIQLKLAVQVALEDFHSQRECGKGSRSIMSSAQAGSQEHQDKQGLVNGNCLHFIFCVAKNPPKAGLQHVEISHMKYFFSQLFGLGSALMFALPVMQLFLPSVSCCYNKPFPIHVISKGEKTAWKQNKENRTKGNQGFFQRPI